MARAFNGTNQYLSRTSAVVSAYPLTFACWFRPTNDTLQQALMSVSDSTVDNRVVMIDAAGQAAGDPVRAVVQNTSQVAATTLSGYAVNNYYHACAVFTSATMRRVFINGGNTANSTASLAMPTVNTTTIGRAGRSTTQIYFAGRIAEAGVWNVALTDSEAVLLASGYAPSLVRPASLVAYWPLSSDDNDASGNGNHLTASGSPTFEDHPPGIVYKLCSWWAWNQFGRFAGV